MSPTHITYLPPNPMTLPQIINELKPEARPQTQKLPLYGSPIVEAILNIVSCRYLQSRPRQSRSQQSRSEFPQFSMLPPELRSKIWQFALPAQRPFQINLKVRNAVQRYFFWAIDPPAMLEVCRESREVVLSVYRHAFQLCAPRDEPGRVRCTTPEVIVSPMDHISMYTRKGPPSIGFQPDLEVHSVVAWMIIPLGFKVVVGERIFIDYFENWPPKENDMVNMLSCSEAQLESRRSLLLDRLKHKEVDWLLQGAGVHVPPPLPQRGTSCGC